MIREYPVLRAVHRTISWAFKPAGLTFEEVRSGEHRLGLWRFKIRKAKKPRRLVVLPGFGDTPLSWLPTLLLQPKTLHARYDEVLLVDFPGFQGMLRTEPACDSMDLLISSVRDLLHGLKPKALIGHSLGGWLAAHYAVICAEEKRKWLETVILACPSGVFSREQDKREWEDRFRKASAEGFHHLRSRLFAKEPIWFRWIETEFTEFIRREDIAKFMGSIEDRHALENRLADLTSKVWLVWGNEDRLVPTAWYQGWLDALPGDVDGHKPTAILIPEVGHSPQLEAPRTMAMILSRILRGEKLSESKSRTNPWRIELSSAR